MKSILACLLLFITAASGMDKSIDPAKLAGTYKLVVDGKVIDISATKTYGTDGSYISEGTGSLFGVGKKLKYKGTWKIEGDEIVFLLSESSTPKQAPVGVPIRLVVESLTDSQMILYNPIEKKRYTENRLKSE